MRQGFSDLAALAACGRLAAGAPSAVAFGRRMLGPLAGAYEDVVAPVVERTITGLVERDRVDRALRAMSAKIAVAMLSYGRLADCEQRLEVCALAGAITRLYDDLIDGSADSSDDDRLSDLLNARPFTPHNDLEHLLAELISQITQRIRLPDRHAFVLALNALHEYQCLSRRQREEEVPLAVLEKICQGKGAMANLTLCSLVKPQMDVAERELVMALGAAFQSLDDYMDVAQDTRNGVTTLASLGVTTLKDIGSSMRVIRPRLAERYGRTGTRQYCGMIYFLLVKSAVGRRLPAIGRIAGHIAGRSTALAFLTRGADAQLAAQPTEHAWKAQR